MNSRLGTIKEFGNVICTLGFFWFFGLSALVVQGEIAPKTDSAFWDALPDKNTVGLWLFDEISYPQTTLTDASQYAKADLCLMEGGVMVAGKYGNALQVGKTDYAVCYAGFAGKVPENEMRLADGIPSGLWGPTEGPEAILQGLTGQAWTIEFWFYLKSENQNAVLLDMGQAYEKGFSLKYSAKEFELVNHYAGVKAKCPTVLSPGKWHHVAFSRDGATLRHYLDGMEQSVASVSTIPIQGLPDLQKPNERDHESRGFEDLDFEQRRQNRFNFAIGSDRHAGNPATGNFDELRISRIARYSSDFTPGSFSRNYGTNAPPPSVANGPALLFNPDPVSIPLQFGSRKHVFIDDAILDTQENLKVSLNHPFGKVPIGRDFEIESSGWRPSVFDVDGAVYLTIPEGYSSKKGLTFLAIAEDGLNFSMKGKIIPETPYYGNFFRDLNPQAPPEERYKLNAFMGNRGMYIFTSPDGWNWKRNETIQLPLRSGGGGECFWDDQRGGYVTYIKRDSSACTEAFPCTEPPLHRAPVFFSNEILKPWPFNAIDEPYYEGWPFPVVTGEGPIGFEAKEYGGVYRTRAIKYPWAPDVYLAFIWRYPGNDKARHVELAVSRNGTDWDFFGTNWYFPAGSAEEELAIYGLIRRGDEIWQYVNEGGPHGGSFARSYSRYRQRLDGFVSLDAEEAVATATTLPLVFQGNRLILNIKASIGARVALTNRKGKELRGYGLEDCDLIKTDSTAHHVTWNGNGDVSSLSGKSIRLKFKMQNTKIYSFEFKK